MQLKLVFAISVAAASLLTAVQAYKSYQDRIPNGHRVPNPCPDGSIWDGVGHQSPAGANARNPFGHDFKAAGYRWTMELCRKDSDGDGLTNGQELGDPDCVWMPGATPSRTTGLSHPGICPLDSATCSNPWTVCPKPFNCPAMNEPHVTVRNFTLKNSPVPAKVTTYMCQAFELNNTASPVHMIGSRPIIANKDVMHHMIIYACSVRPKQSLFDGPEECFMGRENCEELLNLWAYGIEGECFDENTGFRVGGEGFRYAVLELHWNNPSKRSDYTDASGFSIYMTDRLRRYDQGTLMYGEANLVLPPRQPLISFNHTCPGVCTSHYHEGTRYITAAGIHMHTYGIKGRVSLWRNGTLVKDLSPLQVYDYNSPQMFSFNPPIPYLKGDEIKTECYFSTQRSNVSIFFGQGTHDEMCLSFMSYYPNNVTRTSSQKLGQCLAASGMNRCWLQSGIRPQIERGCNVTGMVNGDIPTQVTGQMTANKCFSRTGCDPVCRNYLNNTLWPANACYDPKRARQMAEFLSLGYYTPSVVTQAISTTLYGQRFCEQEIAMLAEMDRRAAMMSSTAAPPTAAPMTPPTTGLTSEHLLIIILVCSCLGFILLMALLVFVATRIGAKPSSGAAGVAVSKLYQDDAAGAAASSDNNAYVKSEF